MTGIDMQIFLENTILHDTVTLKQINEIIEGHLNIGYFTVSNVKHSNGELDYYIDISFEELEIDIEVFLLPTRVDNIYFITGIGNYWE